MRLIFLPENIDSLTCWSLNWQLTFNSNEQNSVVLRYSLRIRSRQKISSVTVLHAKSRKQKNYAINDTDTTHVIGKIGICQNLKFNASMLTRNLRSRVKTDLLEKKIGISPKIVTNGVDSHCAQHVGISERTEKNAVKNNDRSKTQCALNKIVKKKCSNAKKVKNCNSDSCDSELAHANSLGNASINVRTKKIVGIRTKTSTFASSCTDKYSATEIEKWRATECETDEILLVIKIQNEQTDEKMINSGMDIKNHTKNSVNKKLVGCHCSIAGSLHNAVQEAAMLGCRAFGMFLCSQRTWNVKPLDIKSAELFRAECQNYGYSPGTILPHGSYLLNCGAPNEDVLRKSQNTLTDELQRCEMLGLSLYNFHPGSTCGKITVGECINRIAESINMAHAKTKFAITVVENMCGQGHTIGGRFEELKAIIDRVEDKSRIGVCLDTCHAFAAGYDLSITAGFMKLVADFENIIGFKYLKAVHLNDSKGPVGCHLDRHENIGKGHIGLEGFRRIMAEPRFDNMPMILETPDTDYAKEINTLYGLM